MTHVPARGALSYDYRPASWASHVCDVHVGYLREHTQHACCSRTTQSKSIQTRRTLSALARLAHGHTLMHTLLATSACCIDCLAACGLGSRIGTSARCIGLLIACWRAASARTSASHIDFAAMDHSSPLNAAPTCYPCSLPVHLAKRMAATQHK